MNDEAMAELYWRVKRRPREGTSSAAIICHAQACGFVAWVADVHPDRVARAVQGSEPIPAYRDMAARSVY